MMDKERLEEIKKVIESQKESVRRLGVNDIKWLIRQTEEKIKLEKRVQELEEENCKLNGEMDGLLLKLEDREPYYSAKCIELEEQNQRYKQALEFYGDKKNYEISGEKTYIGNGDFTEETRIEVDRDRGKKARQALKGESTIRALEVKQDNPGQEWF